MLQALRADDFTCRTGADNPWRSLGQVAASAKNEYEFTHYSCRRGRRHPSDPDSSIHVDRRFRPRPYGGACSETALAQPPDRPSHDVSLRSAGRLYARSTSRDRLGSPTPPVGSGRPMEAGGEIAGTE